jgi:nitrate/nitrite transport system substrate-binding protein
MQTEKREYTFAQTFPTGTHAMWLYYWMASGGIDPIKDAKVITVPPPQMVANMRVGNMDGYCVGEPWNHRAIADGIGVSPATTQDVWKDHPEKVLGVTADFAKKNPNTCRAVTAAIIEAGKWIDAGLQNKTKMAETIADKSYVNTSVDVINQRILGRYQNGMGKTWDDPNHMKFFNDGAVNYPYISDAMWFLTQHKRWGLLKDHPDYLAVAKAVNRTDIYQVCRWFQDQGLNQYQKGAHHGCCCVSQSSARHVCAAQARAGGFCIRRYKFSSTSRRFYAGYWPKSL